MGASVIAGVDPAPVFELAEHVFDFMALAVECAVMRDEYFAIDPRRNARRDSFCNERVTEPVGIIATVTEHGLG